MSLNSIKYGRLHIKCLGAAALLAILLSSTSAQAVWFVDDSFHHEAFIDVLHLDDFVTYKNAGDGNYEIDIYPAGGPPADGVCKVIGKGSDYVVLQDLTEIKFIRIAETAIKLIRYRVER